MKMFCLPIAASALAALASGGVVQAHISLVSSLPAANAVVVKPGKIILTFNEKLVAKFASATLTMTGMPGMVDHPPMKIAGFTSVLSKDSRTLTLLMKRTLVAGSYTLKWQAVGADAHRTEGSFAFTVK